MEILWLILLVALIILEIATTQFICIWFAGGALAAFVCALLNLNTAVQTVAFVLVSALLLMFTKKLVNKLRTTPNAKTNADALIGQSAVVTEEISNINAKGSVKIRGLEWSARSVTGDDIAKEAYVTVKEIDGVKLIVEEIK